MDVVFKKDSGQKDNFFKDIWKKIIEWFKNFKMPSSFYYFLVLLAVGLGFYIVMLIENNFSLAYGGDYSAQYIPMGYHVWDYYHEWAKTGHFTLFDSTLYLGANSFGSNAYYGLFSPFNIIICMFPRTLVPQAVAICSMIKLACAGLFFSLYMRNAFSVKENVSRICGVAYAFCGWGAFYLWYNNYQDILVFLPLVLWGIERTLKEQKPWLLAVGVFFLAVCNYVLMVPYLVCTFFYAMFRFFQQIRSKTVKDNLATLGFGVAGFAGGLLLALFIFAPAFMATLSSPKLEIVSYGDRLQAYLSAGDLKSFFKLLFSWEVAPDQHNYVIPARVYYPILEFFVPATTCRSLPSLELKSWDFDDMAVSLWCYVPFIMFLVPALIQSGKEKKWSHYIGFALLVLTLFTPFMSYLTMGFSNGYARWTLFIVSSLIAYVGIYIDKIPNVSRWHIHIGFAFAILGIGAAWLLTYKLTGAKVYVLEESGLREVERTFIHRFEEDGYDYTNIAFICELAYVLVVYLVLFFTYNKKAFHILATVFVSAEAIAVGNFVTMGHGWDTTYNNGYQTNERFRTVLKEIQKDDQSYYRVYSSINDAYSVNNGFINNYNTVSFFHSLYNFEIDDFSLWTGIRNGSKSVSGYYRGKYQDLDNLLGVKYYLVSKRKAKYSAIEAANPGAFEANVPFDFEEKSKYEELNKDYLVYENENLSKFGYSYDSIYNGTLQGAESGARYDVTSIRNIMVLAKTAVVNKDDAAEIKALYPEITLNEETPNTDSLKQLVLSTDYLHYFYNLGVTAKNYQFDKIPSIPDDFETGSFNSEKTMDYFVFYTPRIDGEPLFKAGTTFYVRGPFSGSQKYNFYFIDNNNKIFMFDAHDDDTTDNVSYMRGFYIKKDVYKLAVCGKYYQSYLFDTTLRMYAEDKVDYEARRDALNANPITNVTYKKDKFTFETNYDQPQFVVSRVAFDKGWKIKAKDDDGKTTGVKVYKGNGGFVSFVAPKGHYKYEMIYETPYLKASYAVSALSAMGFFTSLLAYHIYVEKKTVHLDKIYREN